MSSVAYSPGIGSGAVIETAAIRAARSSDPAPAPQPALPAAAAIPASSAAAISLVSTGLDPGAVPVDQDRVATIRKAIAANDYPLLPTKIGDAMIAAGMLLRMAK